MRVGIVQFFVRHTLKPYDISAKGNTTQEYDHLFAYVHWKRLHPKASWYGMSATISSELFEIPGACAIIPVQRIACRCAYATLNIKFSPAHHESVFISCPLPFNTLFVMSEFFIVSQSYPLIIIVSRSTW